MKPFPRKPLWVSALSLFLWINTFGMIAQVMVIFGHPPSEAAAIWAKLTFQNKLVMLCSPVAAYGVQRVKPWGWYAVMMFVVAALYNNFILFKFPAPMPMYLVLLATILLAGVCLFFLRPPVIRFFHNENLHWWKTAPRYSASVPVELEFGEGIKVTRRLFNISRTGAFVESAPVDVNPGDVVQVCIRFEKRIIQGLASVIRLAGGTGDYPPGLGLQFQALPITDTIWLHRNLKYTARP